MSIQRNERGRSRRWIGPLLLSLLQLILLGHEAEAQIGTGNDEPEESIGLYHWPYASHVAPRIGASWESEGDRVRLDIGGSVGLMRKERVEDDQGADEEASGFEEGEGWPEDEYEVGAESFVLGVDFFTWSRLRSEPHFKFPVEGVDYYFGIYSALSAGRMFDGEGIIALRLAHISSHRVDGDTTLLRPDFHPFVYSREFADLSWSLQMFDRMDNRYLTPYIGLEVLTHTIPDSLGHFTPYIGLDAGLQPVGDLPLTIRYGAEFRLNSELATRLDRSTRLGLKFADLLHNGLLLEFEYYNTRSPFGQTFINEEEGLRIGFAFGR